MWRKYWPDSARDTSWISAKPLRNELPVSAYPGHEPQSSHQFCPGGCQKTKGRDRHRSRQCQDGRPSPWPPGKRNLIWCGSVPACAGRGVAVRRRGDFLHVRPYVPHQEINPRPIESLECPACRCAGGSRACKSIRPCRAASNTGPSLEAVIRSRVTLKRPVRMSFHPALQPIDPATRSAAVPPVERPPMSC